MSEELQDAGVGPLAELLGMRRGAITMGRSAFHMTIRPEHLNPYAVVHGGVLYTLVDYAMGTALVTRLEPGEQCATVEIQMRYLAPIASGEVRAEAWVIERSRRIGVLEARVTADSARLVATATGSFIIQNAARSPAR